MSKESNDLYASFLMSTFLVAYISASSSAVDTLPKPIYNHSFSQTSNSLVQFEQNATHSTIRELVAKIEETPTDLLNALDECFWDILV